MSTSAVNSRQQVIGKAFKNSSNLTSPPPVYDEMTPVSSGPQAAPSLCTGYGKVGGEVGGQVEGQVGRDE